MSENHHHNVFISKPMINFWLDFSLLLNFMVLMAVATIVQFVFPAGTKADDWILWGYNFNDWMAFQYGTLCLFTLLVLVHVMLHWQWVCGIVSKRMMKRKEIPDDGIRTIYGVGTLVVLFHIVAASVALAMWMIQAPY
jgi:hypothetical protein